MTVRLFPLIARGRSMATGLPFGLSMPGQVSAVGGKDWLG